MGCGCKKKSEVFQQQVASHVASSNPQAQQPPIVPSTRALRIQARAARIAQRERRMFLRERKRLRAERMAQQNPQPPSPPSEPSK